VKIVPPPNGSGISIADESGDPVLVIPNGKASPLRYLIVLFLLFWLGAWVVGFNSAASVLLSGQRAPFVVFWLGGWTIGGVLAALFLYRVLRPPVPQSLRLKPTGVWYDSGIPAFQLTFGYVSPKDTCKAYFPKRCVWTLTDDDFNLFV
jgi:hypothetical protein